jgi:deoxyadenosine/deoxycytidine kinase
MIRNRIGEERISPEQYAKALHGKYRVWMLTPDADSARLVEYEMDQESMEEFLEDYTRFADMVIRIEPQPDTESASDEGVTT